MACNCNKVSNTKKTKRVTKILNLDRVVKQTGGTGIGVGGININPKGN